MQQSLKQEKTRQNNTKDNDGINLRGTLVDIFVRCCLCGCALMFCMIFVKL